MEIPWETGHDRRRMPKSGRVNLNQSVSFPPPLLVAAKKRARNLGLSFSAYVQKCVERDLRERPTIVFEERTDDSHLAVADEHAGPGRTAKHRREDS
jgi:hypothetical protein